jgi:hypothetical protein
MSVGVLSAFGGLHPVGIHGVSFAPTKGFTTRTLDELLSSKNELLHYPLESRSNQAQSDRVFHLAKLADRLFTLEATSTPARESKPRASGRPKAVAIGFWLLKNLFNETSANLGSLQIDVDDDEDGYITFEWRTSANNLFALSFTDNGCIYYAGRLNGDAVNGRFQVGKKIPDQVTNNILRF